MDTVTTSRRSGIMRRIKSKNTLPELIVRRLAYSVGLRYRLHRKDIAGNPDLAFIGKKKVIFVHGCFWHQHRSKLCRSTHVPKSNKSYWLPKLERNVKRDSTNIKILRKQGWKYLVIWECQLKDKLRLKKIITNFLNDKI